MDIDELPLWRRALFIYSVFGLLVMFFMIMLNKAWSYYSATIDSDRNTSVYGYDKSAAHGRVGRPQSQPLSSLWSSGLGRNSSNNSDAGYDSGTGMYQESSRMHCMNISMDRSGGARTNKGPSSDSCGGGGGTKCGASSSYQNSVMYPQVGKLSDFASLNKYFINHPGAAARMYAPDEDELDADAEVRSLLSSMRDEYGNDMFGDVENEEDGYAGLRSAYTDPRTIGREGVCGTAPTSTSNVASATQALGEGRAIVFGVE